jgi:hypothetical protein
VNLRGTDMSGNLVVRELVLGSSQFEEFQFHPSLQLSKMQTASMQLVP